MSRPPPCIGTGSSFRARSMAGPTTRLRQAIAGRQACTSISPRQLLGSIRTRTEKPRNKSIPDLPACSSWRTEAAKRMGLPRSYGIDDLPLVLQDRFLDRSGTPVYQPGPMDIMAGYRGDTIIVNGTVAPVAQVPAGLVRLRLLNAANARIFDLQFSDGRPFHVIASDGGYLAAPVAAQPADRAGRALRVAGRFLGWRGGRARNGRRSERPYDGDDAR